MTDEELLDQIRRQITTHLGDGPTIHNGYVFKPNLEATKTPKGSFSGWVWPVPIWNGEIPVISDGFNRYQVGVKGKPGYQRQHLGVDIMFRNKEAQTPNEPARTKWYHMPNDVPYLAPGPGHVWFAGETKTGWTVKLDHHGWAGFPLISYHTHMSKLFIDEWADGSDGLYVPAGFPLGLVGPGGGVNHCHFEMWDYTDGVPSGRESRALDPQPFLRYFGYRMLQS